MHGLLRVRGFTQDDAHIFCTPGQVEREIASCVEFAAMCCRTMVSTDYEAELSYMGRRRERASTMGSPEQWTMAEEALQKAAVRAGLKGYWIIPNEGAFSTVRRST